MSSYIHIATQTLGSNQASVTFSSIPTTLNGKSLRDLVLVAEAESNSGSGTTVMYVTFNGDTTQANYQNVLMQGNGSTTYAEQSLGRNLGFVPDASGRTLTIAQIFDFAQSKNKTYLSRSNNATTRTWALMGRWFNNAAITSIQLSPFASGSFRAGATFSLYGIEG